MNIDSNLSDIIKFYFIWRLVIVGGFGIGNVGAFLNRAYQARDG
jgi:hypothetical protein